LQLPGEPTQNNTSMIGVLLYNLCEIFCTHKVVKCQVQHRRNNESAPHRGGVSEYPDMY
jgi:hypothetical protein